MASLQDQLLKNGLVNEKQLSKASKLKNKKERDARKKSKKILKSEHNQ